MFICLFGNQQSQRFACMQKELECTKIKDGLYLGNFKTAQDAEFLITNKFNYIVNCSTEIPNFYEGQGGIKYLKFKLTKQKPHKLWDETLKKLKKLDKFIQNCEQNSMCCLIHSYDGVNRSLVMLVAFLMNRYKWKLGKTLEFVRSKQIFIGLSEHYIEQLQFLEQILLKSQQKLTSEWRIQYRTEQEQIVSKTFLNSQQIQHKQDNKRQKKNKRVAWKDIIEKQKLKQQKLLIKQQQKQRGLKLGVETQDRSMMDLRKIGIKDQSFENKKLKIQDQVIKQKKGLNKIKNNGNKSKPEIALQENQKINKKSMDKNKKPKEEEDVNEDQILEIIKKNLKSKKKLQVNCVSADNENQERIYNVTINNYIKPNINILNGTIQDKKKTKKRPQSAWRKSKPL